MLLVEANGAPLKWTYDAVVLPCNEYLVMYDQIVSFHVPQSIGAVNTIIRRAGDGKLVGYNTDCEAAIAAIEDALIGKDINRLM